MKKLFALFVMALFVISMVPAAFAANDNAGRGATGDAGTDTIQARQQTTVTVAGQDGQAGKMKNMRERYQEMREKYAQNKEQVRERLAMAKEKRAEAKAKHQDAQKRIQERKEQLTACKGSETENCRQARRETKRATKEYLSGVSEHVLGLLAKTKERVQASNMPEDQKAEILAKLDERAVEIAGAAESVVELGEEDTKEEFVEAAKIIKNSWKETKQGIKKGVGKVAANKIRAVTTRMEQLQTRVQRTLQRLSGEGKDTSRAQAQLTAYEAQLEAAKTANNEAEQLYQSGDIDGAVAKTKEAHRNLLKAHKALKQLVKDIKGVQGGEEALQERARERTQERMLDGEGEQERMQERAQEADEDADEESMNETEENQTSE